MGDYRSRLLSFIKRAEQATQAAKGRAVRAEGLTTAQYSVLLVLSHSPGITSAELARRSHVTAQTMSSVLAGLVERGLVTRAAHPRHRGVLEVTLTPAGQEVFAVADRQVERLEGALSSALGPADQDRLRDLLARCVTAADGAVFVDDRQTTTSVDAPAKARAAKPRSR